jgi:hypothetical protein
MRVVIKGFTSIELLIRKTCRGARIAMLIEIRHSGND